MQTTCRSAALALLTCLALGSLPRLLFSAPSGGEDPQESIRVEDLWAEAAALMEDMRRDFNRAHEMVPSTERNELLAQIRQGLKTAKAKCEVVGKADPSRSKAVADAVTDIQGMIFWCNKSMAVIVPSSPAPDRKPPPPSRPSPPDSHLPAPLPVPTPLSPAQLSEIEALCTRMLALDREMADYEDERDKCYQYWRDCLKLISGMRGDMAATGMSPKAIRLIDEKYRELERTMEQGFQRLSRLEGEEIPSRARQILGCQQQLEWFREPAIVTLLKQAKQDAEAPLSPEMLGYINRQANNPRFSFTPVPEAAFPAISTLPPGEVEDARGFLKHYLEMFQENYQRGQRLKSMDRKQRFYAHYLTILQAREGWLLKNKGIKAPAASLKEVRQRLAQLRADQESLRQEMEEGLAQFASFREQLDLLQARLDALEASQACVVEDWIRKQAWIPLGLAKQLEIWNLKTQAGH